MPEIIEIRLTDGGSAAPRKDLNGPPQPPKGAGDPAPTPVGAKGQTPIANPTLFPTGGPTPTVGPNAPPQPPVAAIAPPTPPSLPAPPQAVPLTTTAPGAPPAPAAPGGFDPVAVATEQMKREMEARRQREAVDRSRRLIDHEYRLRKEKQELLDRSAMARVKDRLAREQEAEKERKEEDRARREIDPEYRKKREAEEKEERDTERQRLGRAVAAPIEAVGRSAGRIAAGDGSILADAGKSLVSGGADKLGSALQTAAGSAGALGPVLNVAGKALGPLGAAASAATGAFQSLVGGLDQAVNKLAPFSASLSVAQANAEVRQIERDMQRADKLGPELANFVDAKSNLKEDATDLLYSIIEPFIPIATDVLGFLRTVLEWFRYEVPNAAIDVINLIISALNAIIEIFDEDATIDLLRKIERNTREKDEGNQGIDNLLAQLLANRAPLVPAGDPNVPAGRRGTDFPGVR